MATTTEWTEDKKALAIKNAANALNKNGQTAAQGAGSADLTRYQAAQQQSQGSAADASLYRASPQGGQGANISGLSESTLAGLQKYGGEYTPSASVQAAQDYLSGVMGSKPGAFQSKYTDQIAALYDEIMNRPKFSYDVAKDPLFQQYKNQYMQGGQLAMQDAVGNAAALTGGYGSSWAGTAGFQAFQQYLQALNDRIPELEQRAFDRYAYEGEELRKNLTMNTDLDAIDYDRYRDTVQDWKDDRSFAGSLYTQEKSMDMNQWANMQDYYRSLAGMENSDYWSAQDAASKAAQLEESIRQYNEDLKYKYYAADADNAYRQQQLKQNQSQFESDLAYQQYKAALDDAYRRDSLSQNQSQYDADMEYQRYKAALDDAYRRDSLSQSQAQWEAEQALNQAKFDFQLRQYEDALAKANGTGGGGGSGNKKKKQNNAYQQAAAYSAALSGMNAVLGNQNALEYQPIKKK